MFTYNPGSLELTSFEKFVQLFFMFKEELMNKLVGYLEQIMFEKKKTY